MRSVSSFSLVICAITLGLLTGCGSTARFTSEKRPTRKPEATTPVPAKKEEAVLTGVASYYGAKFHGRKTANGETFDMYGLSAAHRLLPFGTRLKVTNLANGKSVVVKVNDRGPFVDDRILDLSYGAARELDMLGTGLANVQIEIIR
ncbi:MAG: septal ring lytic transglycosylase RlpA family protein [Bacteroidetes bacterium]|nr:septal ring lytic transglycosylase RlpA family protein [Bacteroidota bacterium]